MKLSALIDSAAGISLGSVTLLSVLSAILVFLICLLSITVILRIVGNIQKMRRLDGAIQGFIRSAIKAGLWLIAAVIIADRLGIKTASLVTLIGVAGLALSLSIQGVLANLFSGLTLLTTKPFTAGDYVDIDDISGSISEIGLFYTTLITADNKIIYVPNSQVAGTKIVNYTRREDRRVEMCFLVSRAVSPDTVKAALREAAGADARAMKEPAPFAGLRAYRDGAAEYVLRVWTRNEDYWDLYYTLNERVGAVFEKQGIPMSGGQVTIRLEK